MSGSYERFFSRLLYSWVRAVLRRRVAVISAVVAVTAVALYYSVSHFSINVDVTGMISGNLRFRKLQRDFSRDFPNLSNTIVVVINGDTPEAALKARDRLREGFEKERALFKSVYVPGGDSFFERNGLLYMSTDELEGFEDSVARAQPLLALLSRDMSLRGLFSVIGMILEQPGAVEAGGAQGGRIAALLDDMGRTFEGLSAGRPRDLSWIGAMFGQKESLSMKRQYIVLQPYLAAKGLSSGEEPLQAVRKAADELGMSGVKVGITGDLALDYENLQAVRDSVGPATFASLLLVALILYIGLGRSSRLMAASLVTLIVGLIWTTGFAIAFIGSLNMISVTFAVLYIGLGIDYSIQVCLRYRELETAGVHPEDAVTESASNVGLSLFLSCVTTALGFYSFIPTAYVGVAELGLISGTGMFISFFVNLTLLPALIGAMSTKKKMGAGREHGVALVKALPYSYPRWVVAISFIVGAGAAFLLPQAHFDYNPLNLYNKRSESVVTMKELFRKSEAPPWTISVMAKDRKQAEDIARKLSALREVKMALTIFDFVPADQKEKLEIMSDMALFVPPGMGNPKVEMLSYRQNILALKKLEESLLKARSGPLAGPAGRLYRSATQFETLLVDEESGRRAFAELQQGMLSNLPLLFQRLTTLLQASPVAEADLPAGLIRQYIGIDGRYRVQVFPSGDLMNRAVLARFVKAVRAIAPDATDAPVSIYESGRAVSSSFINASLYALVAIVLFLLLELKSLKATLLILLPLFFAMVLTAASSVLLAIPFNFANVVVIPLMLGSGVHAGILFVLRYGEIGGGNENILTTSTARSILFSSFTTMASTGSLAFSSHQGIASIGILLSLCFTFLTFSTLILLPAMLELLRPVRRKI